MHLTQPTRLLFQALTGLWELQPSGREQTTSLGLPELEWRAACGSGRGSLRKKLCMAELSLVAWGAREVISVSLGGSKPDGLG